MRGVRVCLSRDRKKNGLIKKKKKNFFGIIFIERETNNYSSIDMNK